MNDLTKLSPKQKAFADYYIETSNAYKSAIKAGYSENYAKGNSIKLLENESLKKYIADKVEGISKERIATAAEVLEFLTRGMKQELEEEVVSFDMGGNVLRTTKKNTVKEAAKCAELLGKRYQLFTDKVKLETTIQIQDSWFVEDGEDEV